MRPKKKEKSGAVEPMVKWVNDLHFGEYLDMNLPRGCDMVIICVDTTEHQPRLMRLPHQCYRETLKKLISENGAESITVIPYKNREKILVRRNTI